MLKLSEFQLDSGQTEVYNLWTTYPKYRQFLNSASLNGILIVTGRRCYGYLISFWSADSPCDWLN